MTRPLLYSPWRLLLLLVSIAPFAAVLAASASSKQPFQIPTEFFDDRCDPCVDRKRYSVQVFGIQSQSYNNNWMEIQSAMEQASRDNKVRLTFQVFPNTNQGVLDMAEAVGKALLQKEKETTTRRPDALIVTLPQLEGDGTETLEEAVLEVLEAGIPVFGYGAGYQRAKDLGMLGYVAQNEFVAGEYVGKELTKRIHDKVVADGGNQLFSYKKQSALFVASTKNDQGHATMERYQGIRQAFEKFANSTSLAYTTTTTTSAARSMDIHIDIDLKGAFLNRLPSSSIMDTTTPQDIVEEGCPFDILILEGDDTTDLVMDALEKSPCYDETLVAVFSDSALTPQTRERLSKKSIAFAATPQVYLESAFVVMMASIYATTGKTMALPKSTDGVFLSGPKIVAPGVHMYNKLPPDSITNCQTYGFPICNPDSAPLVPFETPLTANPPPLPAGFTRRVCNDDGCIHRPNIRLAGVTQARTTNFYWTPVIAAAHQTALDLGVQLEFEAFEPPESQDILFSKMAAKIRHFCTEGVDGIFVSIPSTMVIESVQYCLDLGVPVVSINAGAAYSKELGLLAHIGMDQFRGGFEGARRLIAQGMKEGYCVIHMPKSVDLQQRCKGFEAGIAEADGVVYRGMIHVPEDNLATLRVELEGAVTERSGKTVESWEGIGLLSVSKLYVSAMMTVLDSHPDAVFGTFDVGKEIFEFLADGRLKFGIGQEPLLQGMLPVHILTYAAQTRQYLDSTLLETGPHIMDAAPTLGQETCVDKRFAVCKEIPDEEMNKLPAPVVAVGSFMVGFLLLSSAICIAWTMYYKPRSELVRISQPNNLIALVCGIVISSLSIVFMSVETEYPTLKNELTGFVGDEENLDIGKVNASCMAVYWLMLIGNVIAFVSLFMKIWKIKMIYTAGEQMRKVQVGLKDVAPYAAFLLVVVLGLLIAWQIVDPFVWVREVEQENFLGLPTESYGMCTSDKGWHFLVALLGFQLVYLAYAIYLCWQCKDIPSDFAESNWVSLCVMCIFQVSVIALPIAAMVRGSSTVAFYFLRACAVFLQNFTVLCLMFVPKMLRVAKRKDRLELPSSGIRRPTFNRVTATTDNESIADSKLSETGFSELAPHDLSSSEHRMSDIEVLRQQASGYTDIASLRRQASAATSSKLGTCCICDEFGHQKQDCPEYKEFLEYTRQKIQKEQEAKLEEDKA